MEADLLNVLLLKDIYPSSKRSYKLAQITSALVEKFGVRPIYNCTIDATSGKTMLKEIDFCMTKDLQVCVIFLLRVAMAEVTGVPNQPGTSSV